MIRTGTQLFAEALVQEGVEIVFGYPGGFAIDLFDSLYDREELNVILPRHEQGLIHAADGYARSTGKPGVCLVTSGPGATNLVTGIATANYDSVPLVCFTGQVPLSSIGNDAFQEADIIGITRSICKYGVTVRDRKDLGRIIKEAFYIATTGKPGPVVVDIPKDIQLAALADEYPKTVAIRGYKPSTGVHSGQLKKAAELLAQAKKPLILAGGGVRLANAGSELVQLAEKFNLPVVHTIMAKGVIPTKHPLFMGNPGMHGSYAANMAVTECDLLLSFGTRFSDRVTSKISEFAKAAKIIHIDIEPASISKNIEVDIPIVADAKQAMSALLNMEIPCRAGAWIETIQGWDKEKPLRPQDGPGLTPIKIFDAINSLFEEAVIVTDVGQHQMWATQYVEMKEKTQFLTSGGMGTMGYGLPAAMGAQLGNPDTPVICISGDGGMQMNIQEMATAVGQELPLILCVLNNTYLGMVRQWQELFFDERYSATCMKRRKSCPRYCKGPNPSCPAYTPDFVRLAESYGACGIRVEREEDIRDAFLQAAGNRKKPTVIEFMLGWDELVLPMVKGGNALTNMILEG